MDCRGSELDARVRCTAGVTVVLAVFAWTCPAAAQTPLAEVLPTMLGPDMRIAPGPGGTHAHDFALDVGEFEFSPTGILRGFTFNGPIIEQLTTFPIGSSSGGFLYAFDPSVGTFTRSTRSFGPSYVERPVTSGRGTLSVGFSTQIVEYDRFDGTRLDGDDVRFHYRHRALAAECPPGLRQCPRSVLTAERSDVLEATVRLKIRSRTMLTTLTYGVTDRLDIGMTIPRVETTLEARVDKRILRLGTASDPTIHSFDGRGADTETSTGGGTASGIGDLRFQAKYNVLQRRVAVGALWDVRVPTGDGRNLLGTGTLFTRVLGVVSTGTRVFSAHANVGATFASKNFKTADLIGAPADEINYTFGFDWSMLPRATVSADVLGRHRPGGDFGRFSSGERLLEYATSVSGPIEIRAVQEFQSITSGDRAQMQAVIGGKIGPWRTMLLIANLLLPVTDVGLTNKPAVSLGVEYTF